MWVLSLSFKLTWNTARCNTSSKKSLKSFSWASRRGMLRKSRSSVLLARPKRFRVDEEPARGRSPDIFRRDPASGPAPPHSVRINVASLKISSLAGMTVKLGWSVWTRGDEDIPLYILTPTALTKDVSLQYPPALSRGAFPLAFSPRLYAASRASASIQFGESGV